MRVSLNETSQTEWQSRKLESMRYAYDLKPSDTVIDIGAYRGEWAEEIWKRYGSNLVVIEPTHSIVGFPHGRVINKAAGTCDGKLSFGGAYYYTSSHEIPTHTFECFDINTLLQEYPEIALVKMNIEGSEFQLLPHIIGAGLHKRVKNLQVQFHEIEGEPFEAWYREIETALEETHQVSWRFSFCWENWQRKS